MRDFQVRAAHSQGASIARIFACGFGPRPTLAPEGGSGDGGEGDAAAKAAADTAAAEKAAAEKAAADAAAAAQGRKPTDEEAKLLKEVMSGKAKLEAAEKAAADAAAALKAYEGIDPEEHKTLKAAKADADKAAAEKAQDWTKLKDMMASEHATQITAKDKEIETVRAEAASRAREVEDLKVDRAFTTSPYVTNDLTLPPLKARQIYGDRIGVVDGAVVGYDKPAGSEGRTVLVGSDGKPLAFDEVVKRMVEADTDADQVKKSKLAPGAGGGTDNAGKRAPAGKIEARGMARISAILKGQAKTAA